MGKTMAGMQQVDEILGKPIYYNEVFEKFIVFIPVHPTMSKEYRMWWFDSVEECKDYCRENAPAGWRAREM